MSRNWAIVKVSGARAKPILVYDSLARSLSRADPMIDPWSKAVGGRSPAAYHAVSAGMRGSASVATSAR